jgi:hypothetical protein
MEKGKTRSAKKITDTVKKIVSLNSAATEKQSASSVKKNDFLRRVQDKAYELYMKRGCGHGNDLDDWYEAERLVRAEIKAGR